MKLIKNIDGERVEFILDKLEDYGRHALYQVSRIINGVKVPCYKECFSKHDFRRKRTSWDEQQIEKGPDEE